MSRTYGIPTKPLEPGAPLSGEYDAIRTVPLYDINDELLRAETELMYAIARHRKAWASLRHHLERVERQGGFADSDFEYKKASSGVSWWRDEMAAQAAVVTALRAMLQPK